MDWHLITCEYPPQNGGVSDYSHLIASVLAATGETVHVWCPPSGGQDVNSGGVTVHQELGRISPKDLRRVGRMLDKFPGPRRLLVQWVPHGYGYRSMNLPFCLWLWKRAKFSHDRVEIMVHEPFLAFREGSAKQDLVAAVHRIMITILLIAAWRVWVSIPDWEKRLRPFAFERRDRVFGWLPVPSTIPVVDDPPGIMELRARYAQRGGALVGHFGAYDPYMTKLMMEVVPLLLTRNDKLSILFVGKGSLELRNLLIRQHPDLAQQVHATGIQSSPDLSRHISACHLMLQPYQDGVSGRRTSAMALLAHGASVVTTIGKATENCWIESGAVKLVKPADIEAMVEVTRSLLADAHAQCRLGTAARALYDERFDVKRTITALREAIA
jgi:glycosyltransferase involved in cell wall biosynthesis